MTGQSLHMEFRRTRGLRPHVNLIRNVMLAAHILTSLPHLKGHATNLGGRLPIQFMATKIDAIKVPPTARLIQTQPNNNKSSWGYGAQLQSCVLGLSPAQTLIVHASKHWLDPFHLS
jgi:hypothetical protein